MKNRDVLIVVAGEPYEYGADVMTELEVALYVAENVDRTNRLPWRRIQAFFRHCTRIRRAIRDGALDFSYKWQAAPNGEIVVLGEKRSKRGKKKGSRCRRRAACRTRGTRTARARGARPARS